MTDSAHVDFVQESCKYLAQTYVPRLGRALETLPPDDLWWRPHSGVISFGNVLLHLEGNVRQWLVCGIGGEPDERDRASEFAATEGAEGKELLDRLQATVQRACEVVAALEGEALTRTHVIQGDETSALAAVYHVVEHFSWHTGQAVWIAKARAGAQHGLAFYDEASVNSAENG